MSERCNPRGIGLSVAVGVFAGCGPIGFHAPIALVLATAFRLNRLWAFVASRSSILPVYLAITFCEIQAGHFLRTGERLRLTPAEAFGLRYDVAAEWLIGVFVVGAVLATAAGLGAYAVARAWERRSPRRSPRAGETGDPVSSRRPAGLLRPSSGSPTSARPGPSL
jgi:uncharacterized protein (DUF2062 family)